MLAPLPAPVAVEQVSDSCHRLAAGPMASQGLAPMIVMLHNLAWIPVPLMRPVAR